MLHIQNVTKAYDGQMVFEGLNYIFGAGCFALNDDSGSGKSSLLSILSGTIHASSGAVTLDGHVVQPGAPELQQKVAYVPDDCLTYPAQTGSAFLTLVAAARKTMLDSGVTALADRFGLTPHLNKRFEQMSLGTRKKFFLTAAAIGLPAVVLADEPDAGLDAAAKGVLITLFKTLGKDRVVLFTSYDEKLIAACEARRVSFSDFDNAADDGPGV